DPSAHGQGQGAPLPLRAARAHRRRRGEGSMSARTKTQGFTLLEVMVAMAILSIGLVAIFSSEVGAMNIGLRARRTDMATLLARCKMAEIEEHVANQG